MPVFKLRVFYADIYFFFFRSEVRFVKSGPISSNKAICLAPGNITALKLSPISVVFRGTASDLAKALDHHKIRVAVLDLQASGKT